MQSLQQFGNIISTVRRNINPNSIARNTTCADAASYLHECRQRQSRGWSVNNPIYPEQALAAYEAGLSNIRPHELEQDWELFRDARPEPFNERWQLRTLATFDNSPALCKAFSKTVKDGVRA